MERDDRGERGRVRGKKERGKNYRAKGCIKERVRKAWKKKTNEK